MLSIYICTILLYNIIIFSQVDLIYSLLCLTVYKICPEYCTFKKANESFIKSKYSLFCVQFLM